MERVDCVVIGAGVVGLAVARQLAMAGREVLLLEAQGMIGTETSSRNSEVIHAGIYYPAGSLKARTCVAGKHRLYAYCAEHGVPHARCGKLIVATNAAQKATLEAIRAKAAANGVDDLEWLEPEAVAALEPEVFCTAALLSPSTGIIDSHGLMLALQGDAENHGALLAFHAPVERGRITADGIELEVGGAEPITLLARTVINSAGLHAPALARRFEGLDPELVPAPYFCKGNYFTLAGARPFRRLIYPVPGRGRPRRARHHRSRRPGAFRPRRGVAGARSTTTSTRRAPRCSTMPCASTIRASRTARSSRAMPASGRRSRPRAPRRPTS